MPKFNLKDDEIRDLVIFLKSRRGINLNETGLGQYRMRLAAAKGEAPAGVKDAVARPGDLVIQGRELVKDRACAACHKILDEDGKIAPDLTFEGNLRDREWLLDHFKNPKSRVPDSIMPAFRFATADFEAITAYIETLKNKPDVLSGADTYKTYCARCHGDKGDGLGVTAFYLDPAPRDLTKASFMISKPFERFVASVKEGVAGTSMPAWGKVMGEPQIRDTLTYIDATFVKEKRREIKPRNVPEKNPVASTAESIARGEKAFVDRCAGCHGRKGDGKGPNSLDIIPHPRNLRNSWFVTSMPDKRMLDSILYGVQGTAMPPWIDYGLSQHDAGDLLNFIRSLNVAPARGQMTASTGVH
jgi:mono/diheme cytochrome c family protein